MTMVAHIAWQYDRLRSIKRCIKIWV